MRPHPQRKSPAHAPLIERYNRATIVFLTVCTKNHVPRLANPLAHAALRTAWHHADGWLVGRYVILPDHVHLFCAPSDVDARPLSNWIAFWKRLASRTLGYSKSHPLWQQGFWDTQLRRLDSYDSKWDYVRTNPVRHGLVDAVAGWPFQGELRVLD
jgi:REP element-mobilizing transposase RayT